MASKTVDVKMCNSNASAYTDRCNGMLCQNDMDCASGNCYRRECTSDETSALGVILGVLFSVLFCFLCVFILAACVRRHRRRGMYGDDSDLSDTERARRKRLQ